MKLGHDLSRHQSYDTIWYGDLFAVKSWRTASLVCHAHGIQNREKQKGKVCVYLSTVYLFWKLTKINWKQTNEHDKSDTLCLKKRANFGKL